MRSKSIYWIYFVMAVVTIGSVVAALQINQTIYERELEKRQLQLSNIHATAINQLKSSINQFATISAALRTYVNGSDGFPDAAEFQQYTSSLLGDLNFSEKYVVSVLDASHKFIYVFDKDQIDPNNLTGSFIPQIDNELVVARLDSIMLDRKIHMSRPVNLYEGWLGISFIFSVYDGDSPIGYVTPILGLQEIIESIDSERISDQFAFEFRTENGWLFDKDKIYDSDLNEPSKSPQKLVSNTEETLESTINMYGQQIKVATAFRQPLPYFNLTSSLIYIGFAILIIAFAYISRQTLLMRALNSDLVRSQEVIKSQKNKLEKQNEELTKLNNAKDLFFSILAHDLKNPLAAIHSMMDMLTKKDVPDKELNDLYIRLRNSTKSSLELLKNVLEWARLNTEQVIVKKEKVNILESVQQVVKTLEPQMNQKQILLKFSAEEDLEINADRNMLKTALRNIISNAIKFTHQNGTITVTGEKTESHVSLYISDTGMGMSKEQVKELFDVGHKTVSEDTEGNTSSGFGLVLTKEFIEKCGGIIHVESIIDHGTTFELTFESA